MLSHSALRVQEPSTHTDRRGTAHTGVQGFDKTKPAIALKNNLAGLLCPHGTVQLGLLCWPGSCLFVCRLTQLCWQISLVQSLPQRRWGKLRGKFKFENRPALCTVQNLKCFVSSTRGISRAPKAQGASGRTQFTFPALNVCHASCPNLCCSLEIAQGLSRRLPNRHGSKSHKKTC